MKRVVKSSWDKVTARKWSEFVNKIDEVTEYSVDSAYRRRPDDWIELIGDDGSIYDAEVTKYHDGTYELMSYNVTPSYK